MTPEISSKRIFAIQIKNEADSVVACPMDGVDVCVLVVKVNEQGGTTLCKQSKYSVLDVLDDCVDMQTHK